MEVKIPEGLAISGVVLSDQVKSLDWQVRQVEFICKAPSALTNEVILKLRTLMPLQ
jgi:mRNA interferase MazF